MGDNPRVGISNKGPPLNPVVEDEGIYNVLREDLTNTVEDEGRLQT